MNYKEAVVSNGKESMKHRTAHHTPYRQELGAWRVPLPPPGARTSSIGMGPNPNTVCMHAWMHVHGRVSCFSCTDRKEANHSFYIHLHAH
jgi:hypothetical protein